MSTFDKLLFANWTVSGLGMIVFTMLHAPWPVTVWMAIVFIIGLVASTYRIKELREQAKTDKSN